MPRKSGSVGAPGSNPWGDPVQASPDPKLPVGQVSPSLRPGFRVPRCKKTTSILALLIEARASSLRSFAVIRSTLAINHMPPEAFIWGEIRREAMLAENQAVSKQTVFSATGRISLMKRWITGFAVCVLILGASRQASADLIVNGGFETGDFSGWTANVESSFVVENSGHAGIPSHSGNYHVNFGSCIYAPESSARQLAICLGAITVFLCGCSVTAESTNLRSSGTGLQSMTCLYRTHCIPLLRTIFS